MAQTVTSTLLARRDPNLENRWPSSQASWQEQIDLAASDVRRDLRLRGYDWTLFLGYDEGGGFVEDYDGTNAELNDLIELKSLELVYRICQRAEPERWATLAGKFENAYQALLERYAGQAAPGLFTTYDADGSGEVDESEQGQARPNPPIKL